MTDRGKMGEEITLPERTKALIRRDFRKLLLNVPPLSEFEFMMMEDARVSGFLAAIARVDWELYQELNEQRQEMLDEPVRQSKKVEK